MKQNNNLKEIFIGFLIIFSFFFSIYTGIYTEIVEGIFGRILIGILITSGSLSALFISLSFMIDEK